MKEGIIKRKYMKNQGHGGLAPRFNCANRKIFLKNLFTFTL
ncbi:hypothetical protein [Flintibacter porci]